MNNDLAKAIEAMPKQDQRQDSLMDQLEDLSLVAVRLGMYDASDYLRKVTWRKSEETSQTITSNHDGFPKQGVRLPGMLY